MSNNETKIEATNAEAAENTEETLTAEALTEATGGAATLANANFFTALPKRDVAVAPGTTLANSRRPAAGGGVVSDIKLPNLDLKNFDPRAFLDGGTCGALC